LIYTPKTKEAMRICFEAHKNQADKGKVPYAFHPFHVAEQMTSEESTIVALLHDVLEDSKDYTLEKLAGKGFDQNILDALVLMTHKKDVPYLDYVANLKNNPLAREVKLADLKHNTDTTRLDTLDDETRKRIEKYKKAILLLES